MKLNRFSKRVVSFELRTRCPVSDAPVPTEWRHLLAKEAWIGSGAVCQQGCSALGATAEHFGVTSNPQDEHRADAPADDVFGRDGW